MAKTLNVYLGGDSVHSLNVYWLRPAETTLERTVVRQILLHFRNAFQKLAQGASQTYPALDDGKTRSHHLARTAF